MVVGPTNDHPRFLRSRLSAVASDGGASCTSLLLVSRGGRDRGPGSHCQKYAATDPCSARNSNARFALLIVDSILPRCRMMPGSRSRRVTSRELIRDTRTILKL